MSPRVVVTIISLAAVACAPAVAAPMDGAPAVAPEAAPQATAPAPAPSVAIVQRITQRRASGMPDVVGRGDSTARRLLDRAGVEVTVVKMSPSARTVSAQWPAAGQGGTSAVIWLGAPAAPPAPKPAPAALNLSGGDAFATPSTGQGSATSDKPADVTPVADPPGGRTPGLPAHLINPPHPPRANIRTLPPAQPGTTLAGRASWYGPGFEGHTTACGSTFDPDELTLASRELRCGTLVEVKGPAATVQATVTDWGPAEWTQRRFDLSRATMQAVAPLGAGVVDVTVTVR
jgi:hypothetical protein